MIKEITKALEVFTHIFSLLQTGNVLVLLDVDQTLIRFWGNGAYHVK